MRYVLAIVIGCAVVSVHAAAPSVRTNKPVGGTTGYLSEARIDLTRFPSPPATNHFWGRVGAILDNRLEQVAENRLYSFKINRSFLRFNDLETIDEKKASIGVDLVCKSLGYTSREIFLGLPLVQNASMPDFIRTSARDSIGNVEEEQISITDPEQTPAEVSWWKRVARTGRLRYGVRPFRANPYAFSAFEMVHHGETLFFGNLRYYYQGLHTHRFETIISVPVIDDVTLDGVYMHRIERDGRTQYLGARVTKHFENGTTVFLGTGAREGWAINAGIDLPW